jgi:hypothetical protein
MKCPRCGGSLVKNILKEVSCISCGYVTQEGDELVSLNEVGGGAIADGLAYRRRYSIHSTKPTLFGYEETTQE